MRIPRIHRTDKPLTLVITDNKEYPQNLPHRRTFTSEKKAREFAAAYDDVPNIEARVYPGYDPGPGCR